MSCEHERVTVNHHTIQCSDGKHRRVAVYRCKRCRKVVTPERLFARPESVLARVV